MKKLRILLIFLPLMAMGVGPCEGTDEAGDATCTSAAENLLARCGRTVACEGSDGTSDQKCVAALVEECNEDLAKGGAAAQQTVACVAKAVSCGTAMACFANSTPNDPPPTGQGTGSGGSSGSGGSKGSGSGGSSSGSGGSGSGSGGSSGGV